MYAHETEHQEVVIKYIPTNETVRGYIGMNFEPDECVYVFVKFKNVDYKLFWGPDEIELDFMKYCANHDVLNELGFIKITPDDTNFSLTYL